MQLEQRAWDVVKVMAQRRLEDQIANMPKQAQAMHRRQLAKAINQLETNAHVDYSPDEAHPEGTLIISGSEGIYTVNDKKFIWVNERGTRCHCDCPSGIRGNSYCVHRYMSHLMQQYTDRIQFLKAFQMRDALNDVFS